MPPAAEPGAGDLRLPGPAALRGPASTVALTLVAISAAAHLLIPAGWTWIAGGAGLLGFLALEWAGIVRSARLLIAVTLGLALVLALTGRLPLPTLQRAVDQGLYLCFFLISLGLLQLTARSSPLIHRCGAILLAQPPGRRYSVLSFGGALFGVLLSLGALGLLGSMIARGAEETRAVAGERVTAIRVRRMTLAALRGFSSVPLWSPASISMPIVMMALPGLRLTEILPWGAALAALFLGLGWGLDRIGHPPAPHIPAQGGGIAPVLRLLLLVICLPVLGAAVALPLGLTVTSGIILSAPFVALIWQGLQARGRGAAMAEGARILFGQTLPATRAMRSELGIFAASGVLGVLIMPLIDIGAVGDAIRPWVPTGGGALALGYLFILLTALLGLNPIVSVTLAAGVLAQLPDYHLSQIQIAMTVLLAWTVALGASPMTAAVRLAAGAVGAAPVTVSLRWNGVFTLLVSLLAVGGLMLI